MRKQSYGPGHCRPDQPVLAGLFVTLAGQTPAAPRYKFDPDWAETVAEQMDAGRVTGLAVRQERRRVGAPPPECI